MSLSSQKSVLDHRSSATKTARAAEVLARYHWLGPKSNRFHNDGI